MKIDIDLCGEVLISRMRETHIKNLLQLLEVIIRCYKSGARKLKPGKALENFVGQFNESVSAELSTSQPMLDAIEERSSIIQQIHDLNEQSSEARLRAATIHYQAQQIATEKIWNNVQKHRQDVARIRANVYPIKPRDLELERTMFEQGSMDHVLPKDSRFKFIANTIDARRQYVDGTGRTEEEVEEEDAVRNAGSTEKKEKEPARPEQGEEVRTQKSWSEWLLAQVRKVESVWGRGQAATTGHR